MTADFGIVLPLWSHAADDGALLERVAGDVGLDRVVVPVVSGPQTQFLLGSAPDQPLFHTDGGWHYPPETKGYNAAGVRPAKARWLTSGDPLAQLCRQAQRLNIRVVPRIDLRGVRGLVEQEPLLCQCNAWGQSVAAAGPCVCNPHLRELLRATLDDLRRYEPAGWELVDWLPDQAVDRTSPRPLSWHTSVRQLLDLCFCPACRQIAERTDIDPDQAARLVRVSVERQAATPGALRDGAPPGEPRRGTDERAGEPLIAAYIAARADDCRSWLGRLADSDPQPARFLVHAWDEPPPYGEDSPWPRLLRISADAHPANAHKWNTVTQAATRAGGLALHAWRPTFGEAAELVRLVSAGTSAGVRTFDFEGLDAAPPEAVTWLKQAVRCARRG